MQLNCLPAELLYSPAFLGVANLVLRIHGKYLEIGEGVLPVKAVALEIQVQLGA